MADEWYPRECEFCDWDAALACEDPVCRERGYGEPHIVGCRAIRTGQIEDCACVNATEAPR